MRFVIFHLYSTVSFIDLIKHIEHFPDRSLDCVASIDELPLVTNVLVKVMKQFLWGLNADLRHTIVFLEEYLQRVAQRNSLSNWSKYQLDPAEKRERRIERSSIGPVIIQGIEQLLLLTTLEHLERSVTHIFNHQ